MFCFISLMSFDFFSLFETKFRNPICWIGTSLLANCEQRIYVWYFTISRILFLSEVHRDEALASGGNILLCFLFLGVLIRMLHSSEHSVNIWSVELNKISKIEHYHLENGRVTIWKIKLERRLRDELFYFLNNIQSDKKLGIGLAHPYFLFYS